MGASEYLLRFQDANEVQMLIIKHKHSNILLYFQKQGSVQLIEPHASRLIMYSFFLNMLT